MTPKEKVLEAYLQQLETIPFRGGSFGIPTPEEEVGEPPLESQQQTVVHGDPRMGRYPREVPFRVDPRKIGVIPMPRMNMNLRLMSDPKSVIWPEDLKANKRLNAGWRREKIQ